jgi:hypothetical protein
MRRRQGERFRIGRRREPEEEGKRDERFRGRGGDMEIRRGN